MTGTPRAGKTVVASVIGLAPEFAYVEEPLTIWDFGLGARDDDRRDAAEATDRVRHHIVKGCAALVAEAGKRRYVDALSYHALRVPFVHRLMPHAKIVHVIREPAAIIPEMLYGWTYRDTVGKAIARRRKGLKLHALPRHALRFAKNYVQSRLHGKRTTWGPRVPGLAEFVETHSAAQVAAYQWQQMVQIAMDDLDQVPRDRWLEVRYERLLEAPRFEARRIAEFCEVDNDDRFVDEARSLIDPEYEFRKKVQPTDAEWAAIEPLIAQTRRRLEQASYQGG
ncbi:MAG: sulfotransferase [Phycisphaerales bacterium]